MNEGSTLIGRVAELWCYPVKSMAGMRLDEAWLHEGQVLGDRALALVEEETGHVVSAKSVRKWPRLLECAARFVNPPQPHAALPSVHMVLADGVEVDSADPNVHAILSERLGPRVRLSAAPPAKPLLEQFHPDSGKITAEPLAAGTFFDLAPLHVLTTATLGRFRELSPDMRFEPGRFRPNVLIDTTGGQDGFVEQDWIGGVLHLGETPCQVSADCFRCVMTTLAGKGLLAEPGVLKAVTRHNHARSGVYATALAAGSVRCGDEVWLRR